MKKIFLLLTSVILSLSLYAQTDGDHVTINKTDGSTIEYNLTGTQNVISKIKNTTTSMEIYLKGLESFGAWETIKNEDIRNVSFSIYHEAEVGDVQLADAAATEDTKRLYKYLKLNYRSKTFSSVIADVNWNHTLADNIYTATGKYPAINTFDFIHIYVPENNGWINYSDITPVTEWAKDGGIVSLMWHFNVPKTETTEIGSDGSGVTCTPSETTFSASNALKNGTWENKWFYGQMDKVADILLKLQDEGVVALWRPFHEAAGNATRTKGDWKGEAWFWWGNEGSATFKQLWQTMFTYLQSKGVHNLIWTWTTQNYNGDKTAYVNDADWYPGDAYVDIVGRDLYGTNTADNATEYKEISERYPTKIVTLSECGNNNGSNFSKISDAWNAGAKWLNFMPWYGSNMPSDDWWKDAFNQSYVITRDQVNLKSNFVDETAKDAIANMGLGWCLGNTLDAYNVGLGNNQAPDAYETCWGQPQTTKGLMHFMKQGGFNAIRVPVTWLQNIDADGNVNEAWMNRVQEVVDYVLNEGMYCIINVHHDTGSGDDQWIKADEDNYAANKVRFEKLWTEIATRFKDYDNHLLFEGYNEMLDKGNTWNAPVNTSSYSALNKYAQSFVNAVRATGGNNAKRNLIVNTYAAANNQTVIDNFTLPTDNVANHLAVEVHSYDPYNWINQYGAWNTTCSNEIKNMFTRLNTRFVSQGIPVVLGEYGTHGDDASVVKTSSDAWKKAAADQGYDIVKQAKAYGIATFYWMNIIDGSDRTSLEWSLPATVEQMKKAMNE